MAATQVHPGTAHGSRIRRAMPAGAPAIFRELEHLVRKEGLLAVRTALLVERLRRDQLIRLGETYPVLGFKLMRNLAAELATKIRNTDWLVRQYQLQLQGTSQT